MVKKAVGTIYGPDATSSQLLSGVPSRRKLEKSRFHSHSGFRLLGSAKPGDKALHAGNGSHDGTSRVRSLTDRL
eukprot:5188402-Amphidinium_carterae.1